MQRTILGAALALSSAILYGIVDFVGGRLSRRVDGFTLAVPVQTAGFLAMLALAPFFGGAPHPSAIAWGAVSGIGSGVAIMFLYRGMAKGQISLVVPLTAVIGAALPAVVGIVLLGDRPSALALAGIACVFPAVWLVSRPPDGAGGGAMQGFAYAVIAGVGVALQYAGIAQATDDAGLWPMVANRLVSVFAVLACARYAGVAVWPPRRFLPHAAWIGALAAVSLTMYLAATRQSLMTVAVVLASLYPAIPVLLGIFVLGERLGAGQKLGLAAAAAAVALIVLGGAAH